MTPLLESVGAHEPQVDLKRDRMCTAIRKAAIPLRAYALKFIPHLSLLNKDIKAYIQYAAIFIVFIYNVHESFSPPLSLSFREFSEGEYTSLQIKQFIDEHLRLKAHIEATFPQYIIIGPFYINVDTVRTGLAKKHKDISQALLDFLAKKLRRDADMVLH